MDWLIKVAKLLLFLLLSVAVGELAYTVHRLRPGIENTISNVDRTVIVIGAAAGDVENGARTWKLASDAQIQESTAILSSTRGTLTSLQSLISRTDASLNGAVLPNLAAAITEQNQSLMKTQEQLRANLLDMQAATQQLQRDLADADKSIGDPRIQEALAHLAQTSEQLEKSMANLNATTGDVKQVADKFRDDYVKPKNRAWAYLKAILGLGSEGRILFSH